MGCGGSKQTIDDCERPLNSKMEKIEIDGIDAVFERCSTLITQVEEKRKFLNDELMENYYHTGGFAYKCPDPKKALECAIWRLGVDNKGKITDIGINTEQMNFEGNNNSEKGNMAANNMIGYMRCLTQEWKMEDLTGIQDQLNECYNEVTNNMDNYMNEIKDKQSSDQMKLMKSMNNVKTNMGKTLSALNCLKLLIERMKNLCDMAPAMMESCTPDKLNEQQANVDKACKSKQTENLPIAFFVIPKNERRANTCKKVEEDYAAKKVLLRRLD